VEYRYLGRAGLKVSELCLGAMTFGRESDEQESHAMLDRFVEAGGNFVDTANVYSTGASEEVVGRWLARRDREELVIATKVRFTMGSRPNERGLSRKHVLANVDASLKRLGTDYIDLYQAHAWDEGTGLEESLSTLDGLVRSGKVRYLGASNFTAWQLQKAIDLSGRHGWEAFVSLQALYNLLDRELEWELVPVSLNEGLGILPWSPLRGGWLTGKYHRGMEAPPPDTRLDAADRNNWSERWELYANDRTWSVVDELLAVARDVGKEPSQVALNWLLSRRGVTAPILGARTLEQLETNLGALGWSLDDEHLARLDEATARRPPYPHWMIGDRERVRA
jgi:aryl-alcohol dehydrogenase-like predicted oxidoreductase